MRSNLLGMCSVVASVAVAGSAMGSVVYQAGTFNYTGTNSFTVPAGGQPQTVVTLGLQFSGTINQSIAGAALKVQYGPAGNNGFQSGPFPVLFFPQPMSTQYAAAKASVAGAVDPSTSFNLALANEGNSGQNAWGQDIVIKYALFRSNGSFAYRHAWKGTYDAASSSYTFQTVFFYGGGIGTSGGTPTDGFASTPNFDWGWVYTNENDMTWAQLQSAAVPAPGAAALVGLAGVFAGRRRRET